MHQQATDFTVFVKRILGEFLDRWGIVR